MVGKEEKMKISQKRTCFGCKALYFDYHEGSRCLLNFKTRIGKDGLVSPIEPCPKPKTKIELYTTEVKG